MPLAASILTLFGQSSAAPDFGIADEPRLAAPVELNRRFALLSEAVADLASGTGVALSLAPNLKSLKVVVLSGPGRPAAETMRDLADLLDAEWKPVAGGGMRLGFVPALAAEREARVASEERAEREGILSEMRRLARVAPAWGDDPSEEMSRANLAARTVADALPQGDAAGRKAVWDAYYAAWGRNGISLPRDRILGGLLSTLDEDGWRRLLAGELVWGSTSPEPGGRAIPSWRVATYGPDGSTFERLKGTYRAFARYDPRSGNLAFAYASQEEGSSGWSGSLESLSSPGPSGPDPFLRRLAAWRSPITKGTDPLLETVARQGVPPMESPWFGDFGGPITLADDLARLHDEFGVPVVGEALRTQEVGHTRRGFGQANLRATLLDWLGSYYVGQVRLARGAVLLRPYAYWRERAAEPDETAARKLERNGGKSLDDYSLFASSLSPVQSAGAWRRVWRVNPSPLNSPPLLRLWGGLTPTERTTLATGGEVAARPGLPLEAIFADALFAGPPKGGLLRRFDGPEVRWEGLRLFGSRSRGLRQEEIVYADGSSRSGAPGTRTVSRATLVITVGEARDSGVELTADLPGEPPVYGTIPRSAARPREGA